ncbi:hypothetical protein E6C27_scaffold34G001680 [Cucumis melo var. makuwa]|uniref:Uncharacterized protein n=1 Tax=Cucumis melo var. makuwa TaxID=1194695 RepID=A0A5A7SJL7_CUCMM|nr:hypothetical protein E6C27_scaffold34G001680 [Cucumis melo var. makuwa]
MKLKNISELISLFFLLILFLLPFNIERIIPTSAIAADVDADSNVPTTATVFRPKDHHHDGHAAVFGAQKRRVYTGPNPLHNR